MRVLLAALGASLAQFSLAQAQDQALSLDAILVDPEGNRIGNVAFYEMAHGLRIYAQAEGLEPGIHGFHIHETGVCETPDFTSAGGHYNPTGEQHGWDNPQGFHAGDLPNVHVLNDGRLAVEMFSQAVSLEEGTDATLRDQDGSAVVIHEGPDDYQTDPAGDAGPRVACAVIYPPQQ